jgi:hypothetical protein
LGILRHHQGLEAPGAEGGAKPGDFLPQAIAFLGLLQGEQQLVRIHRIADETVSPFAQGDPGQGGRSGPARDHDDTGAAARAVPPQEPEDPCFEGIEIEEQRLHGARLGFDQGGLGFTPDPDLVPGLFQRRTDAGAERIVGGENQDAHGWGLRSGYEQMITPSAAAVAPAPDWTVHWVKPEVIVALLIVAV